METILITGGTGKVGTQLVEHFAKKPNFLVLFTSTGQDRIKQLERDRKNIIGLLADFTKEDGLSNLSKQLEKFHINHLVNNARSIDFLQNDGDIIQRSHWLGEYLLDVIIPYELSIMLAKQGNLRKIVNIASMYGVVPFNPALYEKDHFFTFQYSCAKAALIHLTKELAIFFANTDIHVNSISYGGIEGRVDEDFQKKYAELCPKRRMLHDNEVIGAVDFLISNASDYITGHNLIVDGGWSVW